jgi:hypothetical protein
MSVMNKKESPEKLKQVAFPRSACNIGRTTWGVFFIVSSIINLIVTLPNPTFYQEFAELTFFSFYQSLLLNIAFPNAYLITSIIIVFEFCVGLMVLWRGNAVRLGLLGTALWVLFICPAMGWYTIFSPVLLVIPWWLLRFEYEQSLLALFQSKVI